MTPSISTRSSGGSRLRSYNKGVLLGSDPLPVQGASRPSRFVLCSDCVKNIDFPTKVTNEESRPEDDYLNDCLDMNLFIKDLSKAATSAFAEYECVGVVASVGMCNFRRKWGLDRLPLQTRVQYRDLCLAVGFRPIRLPNFRRVVRDFDRKTGEYGDWKWEETISVPVSDARNNEHFPSIPIVIPGISVVSELGDGVIGTRTDGTFFWHNFPSFSG